LKRTSVKKDGGGQGISRVIIGRGREKYRIDENASNDSRKGAGSDNDKRRRDGKTTGTCPPITKEKKKKRN